MIQLAHALECIIHAAVCGPVIFSNYRQALRACTPKRVEAMLEKSRVGTVKTVVEGYERPVSGFRFYFLNAHANSLDSDLLERVIYDRGQKTMSFG